MKKYLLAFRAVHVLLVVSVILCGLTNRISLDGQKAELSLWICSVCTTSVLLWLQYTGLHGRMLVGSLVAVGVIFTEWQLDDIQTKVILMVVGCYLLQMILEKYPTITDILTLFLAAGLVVCMIQKLDVSHMEVVLCGGYIVLGALEGIQRRWKKVRQGSDREYILWILPFVGIYMTCLLLTPVQEEPYDWQWAKDIYNNIHDRLVIWSQSWDKNREDDFDTALAGFSEDGYLVGSLLENDKELMTLQGTQGVVTNLYLAGKVYDTFEGRQWTQKACEDVLPGMDTVELLYAVMKYDEEAYEDYIYRAGLGVCYEYFRTEYLFAPLKVAEIEDCEYVVSGSNRMFPEAKGYDNRYRLSYWQMNLDHPCVYEMLETNLPEDEEMWNLVLERWGYDKNVYTQEALREYRRNVHAQYSSDVELSDKMRDWIMEVKEQETSTIQKLRCIEAALSSLEYTKSPGMLPEYIDSGTEFLDYFVGERKQGYCSYFATAFVLLARAEGLPARYVEGFCVPLTGNKNMKVTANMAHAWPEVYIEGKGWIPFEPTPGYYDIRYTPWDTGLEQSEYIPMMDEEEIGATDIPNNAVAVETGLKDMPEDKRIGYKIVGLMVMVSTLLLVMEQFVFRYRLKHMNMEERFVYEVHKNRWLLARLHLRRGEEETLEEFANRSVEKLRLELSEEITVEWISQYEEYLYGEGTIHAGMIQCVIDEQKALLILLKNKRRIFYYYIWVCMIFVR